MLQLIQTKGFFGGGDPEGDCRYDRGSGKLIMHAGCHGRNAMTPLIIFNFFRNLCSNFASSEKILVTQN